MEVTTSSADRLTAAPSEALSPWTLYLATLNGEAVAAAVKYLLTVKFKLE